MRYIDDVLFNDIPEWYSLGFDIPTATFTIRIPRITKDEIYAMMSKRRPIVRDPEGDLDLGDFVCPDHEPSQKILQFREDYKHWGYKETVTSYTDFNGEEVWQIGLPGYAPNGEVRARSLYHVSATLLVLFHMLLLCEAETRSKQPQLLSICGFNCQNRIYGGSLSAHISPSLCGQIGKFPDESEYIPIEEAMMAAWEKMRSDKGVFRRRHFQAICRQPQWINLTVPGNACGLDPSDYKVDPGCGYKLVPHNTDHPAQQLTLLAGLAKLYELARKDY